LWLTTGTGEVIAAIQQLGEQQQKTTQEVLNAIRARDEQCSISGLNSEKWNQIVSSAALSMNTIDDNAVAAFVTRKSIPAFQWGDDAEASQADRYMAHLRGCVSLSGRTMDWIKGDSYKNLLSTPASPMLPFGLKGTCDAALVLRGHLRNGLPQFGLAVLWELKKVVTAFAVYQALGQLLAACIACPNQRPVAVLTDLADSWRVYFADGQAIYSVCLDNRRDVAVGLIEEVLKRFNEPEGSHMPAGVLGAAGTQAFGDTIFKRRRLAAAAAPGGQTDTANLSELEPFLSVEEYREAMCAQVLTRFMQMPGVREGLLRGAEGDGGTTEEDRNATDCWEARLDEGVSRAPAHLSMYA